MERPLSVVRPDAQFNNISFLVSNDKCFCIHSDIQEILPEGVNFELLQLPPRLFPQPKGVWINFIPNSLSNIFHNKIPPAISALKLYYILYHIFIFFSNYLQEIYIKILFNFKFFIFSLYISQKLYIHN